MGRHGGGSSSGGVRRSSSSRSSSSRRRHRSSGGTAIKSSKKPFKGSYDRSYYYNGRYYPYYTTDEKFGIRDGFDLGMLGSLIFLTIHMIFLVGGMCITLIHFGEKIEGSRARIQIVDTIDLLTPKEEKEIMELLDQIYDKSGMPVTIMTQNFDWKDYYYDIEDYSEDVYHEIGTDETAAVVLFTQEEVNGSVEWEYDMCFGDDTITCISDGTMKKLIYAFQESMEKKNLYHAITDSWNLVMEDLAKTKIHPVYLILIGLVLCFYVACYIQMFSDIKKRNHAKQYFSENPQMLKSYPINYIITKK